MMDRFWGDLVVMDPYGLMIHPPEYAEVYSKELLKKLDEGDGLLLWAVVEEQKVGFVAGIIEEQSPSSRVEIGPSKTGRILELYVDPIHRKKQIGVNLMKEIETYFAGKECNITAVEVFAPNSAAHQLYRKLGYSDWVVDLFKKI